MGVRCGSCGEPLPIAGLPHLCPRCGGLYELDEISPEGARNRGGNLPGIWALPSMRALGVEPVTLGEGATALVPIRVRDRDVFLKCEFTNPTGSFKDRGMAALVGVLKSRGLGEVVEDSSGNAGASLAAYSARAGIHVRVFVPESAAGPKLAQIRAFGAEVTPVGGARERASEAAQASAGEGAVYASHAYSPFCLAGYETCADEIVAQLGGAPSAVILPVGQGGLLLGLSRGFRRLERASRTAALPALVGVQAVACAPFCNPSSARSSATIAEGIRISRPVRRAAVVQEVRASGGRFVAVSEEDIVEGRDRLARMGFYVEATSAVVWRALDDCMADFPDPLVVVLTGTGLKARLGGD